MNIFKNISNFIEQWKHTLLLDMIYAIKDREFKEFIKDKSYTEVQETEIKILCNGIATKIFHDIWNKVKNYK